MSDVEPRPDAVICENGDARDLEVLDPRDVPLGGPRAMSVRRTLPQRGRTLIGSWCFLDHYGPDAVETTGGMRVPRHPHTGLATVSWLFTGEIDHLDSAGFEARVRPGEVNLMVAGRGISHEEISTPHTRTLHGAQLWYALPDGTRHMPPTFHHYAPAPVSVGEAEIRVFLGSLAGSTSPVPTYTPPLLGAEIRLPAGGRADLELRADFEYGVLPDGGAVHLDGTRVASDHLAYVPLGRRRVTLAAGEEPVRLVLIGGVPLGERIVMWWNFVGRDHDEVAAFRAAWQAEISAGPGLSDERFGPFPAGRPDPLPAPVMPPLRLRPRD
ncbi:pirin family protein [Kineosporia succinea]|uniref:Redox-sensitive bicupin YhaK (Pirin superfamily) n=1 Tax=Kineosporia succinea TaxID=84632 RepID=A0ABT9NWY0_9ACTN|nr:pirin family protein [Kineosporia succinea]MDP9824936.1 redox-sensitive bicupin YhaK (pirin superfamily) [Kineosporia succinea]